MSTHRSVCLHNSLTCMGNRTDFCIDLIAFMGARKNTLQWGQISCSLLYLQLNIRRQGRSDFSYARPRMRDIFAAELRLNSAIFFSGTRSRSSSERACWIGDVRSVFVFCFCFPMSVYQVKTVPQIPLYMTSTYKRKTAVQYRMTPIYNSTLTTAQYRTFTDPLL